MRVFLDANILFSAAKSDGAVRQLLQLLLAGGHECCADEYVVTEARRNLLNKGPEAIPEFEQILTRLRIGGAQAPQPQPDKISWLPDKDQPVLAAAMRIQCDALVTGDRTHFSAGYGKTFGGVTIHSPRSLAEQLLTR